jgi:hypothetical protein
MRALLIVAAAGALLASAAALAQVFGPGDAPPYGSAGYYGPPPPPPPPDYSEGPGYGPSGWDGPQRSFGGRLYASQPWGGDDTVEVASNRPVRDTPRTRVLYPPLSDAGWRTAPAGN